MSRMVAPLVMWVWIVVAREVAVLAEWWWRPPSEKESGVTLRMDISRVLRVEAHGVSAGVPGASGVRDDSVVSEGGRLRRWSENVRLECEDGGYS